MQSKPTRSYKELTNLTFALFLICQLKGELSRIVEKLIEDYDPVNGEDKNLQDAWDYVQKQVSHKVKQGKEKCYFASAAKWFIKLG